MTRAEYQAIRELIENRFRQDMGALERVWFTVHGVNPPDSVISLARPKQEDEPAAAPAAATPGPTGFVKKSRAELKMLSAADRKIYKAQYMRDYAARKRAGTL